jgi:hypothetical protein
MIEGQTILAEEIQGKPPWHGLKTLPIDNLAAPLRGSTKRRVCVPTAITLPVKYGRNHTLHEQPPVCPRRF